MVMVRVRVQPWMRTRLKVEQGQVILGPDLGEGQGQVTLGWVEVRGRFRVMLTICKPRVHRKGALRGGYCDGVLVGT